MTPLWMNDISILVTDINKFWPNKYSTLNEKINAISRYILYTTIALFLYSKKPQVLGIGIAVMIGVTYYYIKYVGETDVEQAPDIEIPINKIPYKKKCKIKNVPKEENSLIKDPLNENVLEKTFYKVPEQDITNFQEFVFNDMSKKENTYYKGYGGYGK